MAGIQNIGSVTPDNLIGGQEVPLLTKAVVIASGQGVLKRGSVFGIITATNKGKLVNKASEDGSQFAKYILPSDVDTTSADVTSACYQSGIFNRNALIFGGDSTANDHEAELRNLNIYLKDAIAY